MTTAEDTVIMQKTLELCQAIIDQPDLQSLRRHIDAFVADDQAQLLYQSVVEKGQNLHQKQQSAQPLPETEITEFEASRKALLEHPAARSFLEAQQQIHGIQDTITRYVTKTFEIGRVPTSADFETCGAGCSCGH